MTHLPLMEAGTAYFADRLRGADLARPSGLPGWTRAHVVAHVACNARAIGRLAHWARTGVETPMYASRQARDAEIEAVAAQQGLPELAERTARELSDALGELTGPQWQAEVRTAQGRLVPASEIVWMRCREVWIHGVDLATGGSFADFPAELVDGLLTDVAARGEPPAITLVATDRDRAWHIGEQGVEVRGTAAGLAAWVTGRAPAPRPDAPRPARWL